jgi:hypothetical protein
MLVLLNQRNEFFNKCDKLTYFLCFFFLFLLFCGGTLWHLQKFLQCIKYIILKFTPNIMLLYPLSSIPGIFSTGLIFPFTHMCAQYLHCIHPPPHFPHISHMPLSRFQTLWFLFSDFHKEKKKSLLIVEESYIENILVTFLYIFVL